MDEIRTTLREIQKMKFLFLVLALSACTSRKHEAKDQTELSGVIKARAALYCEKSSRAYKDKRYVHSKCDGAGFTSLYAAACGGYVDLSVFENADGSPRRDPNNECYPPTLGGGGSKSGFSRDMALMRLLAAVESSDLDWLQRFISYAEDHTWKICDAVDLPTVISRCQMSPSLVALFIDARHKLKGEPTTGWLKLTKAESDDALAVRVGFEAHLQVLGIYLSGRVRGAITDQELATLKAQTEREQGNALFHAVYHLYFDGDQGLAQALLVDLKHFPEDRLPSSKEHCEEYLYQRDEFKNGELSDDWQACEPFSEHSGTDYALTTYILGQYK